MKYLELNSNNTLMEDRNICIKCGMCCDGTMFPEAMISDEEKINLQFNFNFQNGDKRTFQLPCSYLKDKKCTIYQNRPYNVCDKYKCKLLNSLNNGQISYNQAIEKIENILKIREQIISSIGRNHRKSSHLSLGNVVENFRKYHVNQIGELEFRKKFGQTILDYKILRMGLKKWFYKEKDAKFSDNNSNKSKPKK